MTLRLTVLALVGFSGMLGVRLSASESLAIVRPDTMQAAVNPATGQIEVTELGQPVLRYNYQTVEPGERLNQIAPDNLKYAKARSDYIHPLYGLQGEVLTKDWSLDHPHHRGIYWAWPEVTYHGELADLHALQRIFARPSAHCTLRSGARFAEIDAENFWRWEDGEPIVRERAMIRAYQSGPEGRYIDLELHFVAIKDDVTIARRGTDKYGGLNLRFAAVADRAIVFHTDPLGNGLRRAWSDLSGRFPGNPHETGVTILQSATNPDYPGDWVQFPELNWLQPTFPAAQTRYVLKKDQPLILRFRLWIHPGAKPSDEVCAEQWTSYQASVKNP